MNYYDVTFHELSGKTVIKRNIPSEKEGFEAWQDACIKLTDTEIQILVNDGTYITMNRQFIVRIDVEEVVDPTEKVLSRKDEIMGVVNTLSNMGF
ncbi:hypothetical protein [Enterococcus ratti]|uniref:Uncharacterized protein n=1 Tax=Enterococcus ratti TaxID=150033 RepID=A0A1L8WRU9_9ENTE|nr:hypothetical protein [Enterococcus ratti]OJG83757.1 hypothetical protein RV14_GL000991 [Enterococcus ratti]